MELGSDIEKLLVTAHGHLGYFVKMKHSKELIKPIVDANKRFFEDLHLSCGFTIPSDS